MLLVESNFQTETMCESVGDKKNWYIQGIFMQEDVVNRNKRRYPRSVLEPEVGRYIREWVEPRRAIGELNHPNSPIPDPNFATHLTESIEKEGSNYIGKARIISSERGRNVIALLEVDVRLGVSSRATGNTKKSPIDGINEVQSDLRIGAIDIVLHPSAPDAFVRGLMEGAPTIWNTTEEDQELLEGIKQQFNEEYRRQRQQATLNAMQAYMDKIMGKR